MLQHPCIYIREMWITLSSCLVSMWACRSCCSSSSFFSEYWRRDGKGLLYHACCFISWMLMRFFSSTTKMRSSRSRHSGESCRVMAALFKFSVQISWLQDANTSSNASSYRSEIHNLGLFVHVSRMPANLHNGFISRFLTHFPQTKLYLTCLDLCTLVLP